MVMWTHLIWLCIPSLVEIGMSFAMRPTIMWNALFPTCPFLVAMRKNGCYGNPPISQFAPKSDRCNSQFLKVDILRNNFIYEKLCCTFQNPKSIFWVPLSWSVCYVHCFYTQLAPFTFYLMYFVMILLLTAEGYASF